MHGRVLYGSCGATEEMKAAVVLETVSKVYTAGARTIVAQVLTWECV